MIEKNVLPVENHHGRTVRESAIDILPLPDRLKLEREEERSKKGGTLSNYVDLLLSRSINFSKLGLSYDHPVADKYSTLVPSSEPQSMERERQERADKRKKIRDKA